jgi:glycerate 2-kinase
MIDWMLTPESFSTYSLRNNPHGEGIQRILAAAIQAVEPGLAVRRQIQCTGELLRIGNKEYDLGEYKRIFVVGLGKAAPAMTRTVEDILGERISSGLIVTKQIPTGFSSRIPIMEAGHPVPDERSVIAGRKIIDLLDQADGKDLFICLISGGGSALVTVPYPGISLLVIQELTTRLLACGARIDEINILRRCLDEIKGGGMAHHAAPARLISLILSDVVGNPLEAIASGPTVANPTSRADAMEILNKYHLLDQVPLSILDFLKRSQERPSRNGSDFDKVENIIVGSNLMAAMAALDQAKLEGYNPYLLQTNLQGEAREVAHVLCDHLRWAYKRSDPVPRPACLLAGGETTVTLRGDGKGGRNLELALSAVTDLADFPNVMLVSLATDGEDGTTDSAGAVVNGASFKRALELGLDPGQYLAKNDSYSFFSGLDDLMKPGPTGTNVNDLVFLFAFRDDI